MNSSKEVLRLDRVIIDHVLALQDSYPDGVSMDSVVTGTIRVYEEAERTPPTPKMVIEKVSYLLGYDSMLMRTDDGNYYTIDLDAFSCDVTPIGLVPTGLPCQSWPISFALKGQEGGGVDISDLFEDDDDEEDDG